MATPNAVHEKTVLLPLLPISFLFAHDALLAGWFSLLSTFRYGTQKGAIGSLG